MEFKLSNEVKLPEKISFNYEEIKAEVQKKVDLYANLVYTDEQIGEAKEDRAKLNKFKLALDTKRKEVKNECLAPFEEFERQVKELVAMVDKPIGIIDSKVKEYEEKLKTEKQEKIVEIFTKVNSIDWLKLEPIFNDKWLNKTYKLSTIEEEIKANIDEINTNVNTLSSLEYGVEAIEYYKKNLDMNRAIAKAQEFKQIAEIKAKQEEEKRQALEKEKEIIPETKPTTLVEQIQQTKKIQEEERTYTLQFEIVASREQLNKLKEFLTSEKITFRRL